MNNDLYDFDRFEEVKLKKRKEKKAFDHPLELAAFYVSCVGPGMHHRLITSMYVLYIYVHEVSPLYTTYDNFFSLISYLILTSPAPFSQVPNERLYTYVYMYICIYKIIK